MTVSVTEAKNRLTELLVKVENGESVLIERHGQPIATIERVLACSKPRFGTMKGRIQILDPNWAAPQTEEEWLAGK